MSVQYFYEISSPSAHMVPHSPFMKKPSAIVSSPIAIVPDIDNSKTLLTNDTKVTKYIGRQSQLFPIEVSSPLPTGRVPSLSPRTPQNSNVQPREQQVPSQTPILRGEDNSSRVPPLDLFTEDDNIFL